ncbi:MAG: phosphoribosyl-ATP diphosphatase [bacterium]|nr:phosphoribosyl-ATP diphosphatase [bacterium]
MTFEELYTIIGKRIKDNPKRSYTASIVNKGTDRIIQKVGEEAVEVIIAAKNNDKDNTIAETADLLYHLWVLLSVQKITVKNVYDELEKRRK